MGACDPAFRKWAKGKLNDKRAEDVWSYCQLGRLPITNPHTLPLDHPNPRRVGRRRSQQCDAKRVSAEVCRQPSLRLQRSNPWRGRATSFPRVGFAALISFNVLTPTHVSELASPMLISLSKVCLAKIPWRMNDPSGKSRCTDQKLQSSASDDDLRSQGPV